MKSRGEIGVLFEALAVAQEAITDALHVSRARQLVHRLTESGEGYADILIWATRLADDLPARRRDDAHIVMLARGLRAAIQAQLRPAPVGMNRADIHG